MTLVRYSNSQVGHTLIHPLLPQPAVVTAHDSKDDNTTTTAATTSSSTMTEIKKHSPTHSFVVCSDTQIGMTSKNLEWETELEYSRQTIKYINNIEPRPLFCCMCGDLVDMEYTFFEGNGFTREQCDQIQDQQNEDFKKVWSGLHEDIAMVCLCGNHDIGNRPTKASIEKFTNAFGDDYLAFWVNGTYNIVLNTTLICNPLGAEDMYEDQLSWLEERLKYAQQHAPSHIFVFGHHPWFLYNDDEDATDLHGISPYPIEWGVSDKGFPDSYFIVPKKHRMKIMKLCKDYNVAAAFSGHYHQNHISKASFGMDMIITSSLSMVFQSTGKPKDDPNKEPNTRGVRIVDVEEKGKFRHRFVSLE